MEKAVSEAEELPKAIVRRVVKDKLSRCSADADINVHKDTLLTFSESARIFIHYLSATANDICKESKRQTINGDDVFKALEEIEFSEFLKPLQASLDEFKKRNAGKKKGASQSEDVKKKRKLEDEPSDKKDGSESKQDENDEDKDNENDEDKDNENDEDKDNENDDGTGDE
ncbi:DNA polymerase epsilon subunit 3 [Morus notabilis]|uniref:DNA polymerase epsilon subunit 3 n=1 Tax=Morus notabilis TaxID=981085 RepID=W9QJ55_9ROSA|nr:DNA polymerase epsilon subunit 3 [Morus notabilis]EXB38434.1 DNA polymerase epsilon subunit 3 [Morus notabilis]